MNGWLALGTEGQDTPGALVEHEHEHPYVSASVYEGVVYAAVFAAERDEAVAWWRRTIAVAAQLVPMVAPA